MRKEVLVLLTLFCLPIVVGATKLDVNNFSYDPVPAQPGRQLNLWVNVTNNSNNAAEGATAELIEGYPFSLLPGQNAAANLGTLNPYQTRQLSFKLLVDSRVFDGNYDINIRLSDKSEAIKTTRMNIRVLVKNPKVELIKSSRIRAAPGQELPLELTVKNIGGSNAKNVVVKIKEDRTVTSTGVVVEREIIPLGASAALVSFLKPDEEATVKMLLGVNKDATLKNYSLPVTIEYYDENGSVFSNTGYIGLNVATAPELDAVISSLTPIAFPGSTSEIGVDVFNIGAASASYVVAEVSLDGVQFSEDKLFVGTLDPDDFDSFKVTAKFSDKMKTGNYDLLLKLSYKDENNETKTVQKNLPIKIVSAAEAQAASGNAGIAILGIIGLLLELVGLFVVAKFLYGKARNALKK